MIRPLSGPVAKVSKFEISMSSKVLIICAWIFGTCTCWPSLAQADTADKAANLGSEVRGIFSAKCSQCHGPNLVKPKGKFGYVQDLERMAANPKILVPFKPAE